jgi:hypothetical protein
MGVPPMSLRAILALSSRARGSPNALFRVWEPRRPCYSWARCPCYDALAGTLQTSAATAAPFRSLAIFSRASTEIRTPYVPARSHVLRDRLHPNPQPAHPTTASVGLVISSCSIPIHPPVGKPIRRQAIACGYGARWEQRAWHRHTADDSRAGSPRHVGAAIGQTDVPPLTAR